MRTRSILPAIFILAFSAYSQDDLALKHHGNLDLEAMQFSATHLSELQCYRTNYQQGRALSWEGIGAPHQKVDGTTGATVRIPVNYADNKTPAWISQVQEEGKEYRSVRLSREKRFEAKLSQYSSTETSIAATLGKEPWEIDRKQLKKWAHETDGVER